MLEQNLIIQILKRLLEILSFLHDDCHIIHRDIRPENIIIDKNNNIKLTGFDIAAYLIHQNQELVSRKSFKGSKNYVPPDILNSKYLNYDYKIDIFSLGFTMYNLMNPNEIDGKVNLPYYTDRNMQRALNKDNNNQFYDDWLMDFIKTFYSIDPNSRPTAKLALSYLLQNQNNPRRPAPDISINKNIGNKKNDNKLEQTFEEFIKANNGNENKIISSMKSLIQILNNLEIMPQILGKLYASFFNHMGKNLFIESFFNIFNEFQKNKSLSNSKIKDFTIELFNKNISLISGSRPIILFFMMSSLISYEYKTICPNDKNEILDDILKQNIHPLDCILPFQNYKQFVEPIMEKIYNFKKNKLGPFVNNFSFLCLLLKKCPKCKSVIDAEIIDSQFLQLILEKNEDDITNLIENYFKQEEIKYKSSCNHCGLSVKLFAQLFCLNSPAYLLMELEDRNKVSFKDGITLPLFDGKKIGYKFVGVIYIKDSNHSVIYKQGDKLMQYSNDQIKELKDNNLMNLEKPSMAIYQKVK